MREAGVGGSTGLVAVPQGATTLDKNGLEELADRHATGNLLTGARTLDLTTRGHERMEIISDSMHKRRRKAIQDAIDRTDEIDQEWADPLATKARAERVKEAGQQGAKRYEDRVAYRGQRITQLHNLRHGKVTSGVAWTAVAVIAAFATGPFALLIGIPGAIKLLRAGSLTARIGWQHWRTGRDTTRAARARIRAEHREEQAQEKQHEARKAAVAKEVVRRMSKRQGIFRRPGDLSAIMDVDAKGGVIVDAVEAKVGTTRQAALDKNRALIERMTEGAVITHSSGDPRMTVDTRGGNRIPEEVLGRVAESITLGSRRENVANLEQLARTGVLDLSGGYRISLDPDPNSPARRVTDRVANQSRITRDDVRRHHQDQRRVARMHAAGARQQQKNQKLALKQQVKAVRQQTKRQVKAEKVAARQQVKAQKVAARKAAKAARKAAPGRLVTTMKAVETALANANTKRAARSAAKTLASQMAAASIAPSRPSRSRTSPSSTRPDVGRHRAGRVHDREPHERPAPPALPAGAAGPPSPASPDASTPPNAGASSHANGKTPVNTGRAAAGLPGSSRGSDHGASL